MAKTFNDLYEYIQQAEVDEHRVHIPSSPKNLGRKWNFHIHDTKQKLDINIGDKLIGTISFNIEQKFHSVSLYNVKCDVINYDNGLTLPIHSPIASAGGWYRKMEGDYWVYLKNLLLDITREEDIDKDIEKIFKLMNDVTVTLTKHPRVINDSINLSITTEEEIENKLNEMKNLLESVKGLDKNTTRILERFIKKHSEDAATARTVLNEYFAF